MERERERREGGREGDIGVSDTGEGGGARGEREKYGRERERGYRAGVERGRRIERGRSE